MSISNEEFLLEKKKLADIIKVLNEILSTMGQEIFAKEEKITEFRKLIWNSKADLDPQEMQQIMTNDNIEASILIARNNHFRKLYQIQDSPYFASIIFVDEDNVKYDIYIGITYLENDLNNCNYIYDWRSPICSLFYDYEVGEASYITADGIIKGELKRKRQYKIENSCLLRVFDNSINIDDDLLQEVLANDSDEKMKNIVNTIQKEQNSIIRNIEDKNLIVQGIAGSGKTSVALHRIAFLLYKIKFLRSNNILIFSPNQIFTEYISNVLPELGEDNTLQTTFHDYLSCSLSEYKSVESFVDFVAKHYSYQEKNENLVKYKLSNEIIKDMNNFINHFVKKAFFLNAISENDISKYETKYLNELLHNRYAKFPLLERIDLIADKLSEENYQGTHRKSKSFHRLLKESLNIKFDFKKIYKDFYQSVFCQKHLREEEINLFINAQKLNYEDAILLSYLKGKLCGFKYESNILQVVIDEAQDYSRLQYIILANIFKKASFTILGDINQTINPYYKYSSLEELKDIFNDINYLELKKTYRSSAEIINYTNKILGLNHVSAIRKENNQPVIEKRITAGFLNDLINDINEIRNNYKSLAIITKDDNEATKIYDLINKKVNISLINNKTIDFKKDSIIIPAYIAKGLEFDAVIIYNDKTNSYQDNEKNLFYVACTRAQHRLIIYN